MKRSHRLSLAGLALLLASCSSNAPSNTQSQANPPQAAPSPQVFSKPLVAANRSASPVNNTVKVVANANVGNSVRGLLPTTDANQRVIQIATGGRTDPFSPVNTLPSVLFPARTPSKTIQATKPPVPLPSPNISTIPLPAAPIATIPVPVNPAPAAPPVTPTSVAEAIQVTGIAQIGGQASAIVKVAQEESSRYVRVGDYLANGSVRVKRIQVTGKGEPIVVLEQNGIEVIKTVGSGAIASAQ